MIAQLSGRMVSTDEDTAVIDVNGVGYLVHCASRTLGRLPGPGEAVTLLIETHVREDRIQLFGFADAGERTWFRLLTGVQGVGNKVALGILAALSPNELIQAIAAQDKAVLTRAPSVGPKLAQRIVSELKDKATGIAFTPSPAAGTVAPAGAAAGVDSDAAADAVSALVNLGFGRTQAVGAVANAVASLGPDAKVEGLITQGLKELSQ